MNGGRVMTEEDERIRTELLPSQRETAVHRQASAKFSITNASSQKRKRTPGAEGATPVISASLKKAKTGAGSNWGLSGSGVQKNERRVKNLTFDF